MPILSLEEIQKIIDTIAMAKNVIALVDCDSFFVSCEQKVNPELKGKPVCVLSANKNGCVISRSKEAKKMGVPMGIPFFMAKKEYPKAIYIRGNHDLYEEVSEEVMAVLTEFSPQVEVYSVDEAFVDLTGLRRLYKMNYVELAEHIRKTVKEKVDIPVSIGIGPSKSLAKLASDKAKKEPSGVYTIYSKGITDELKKTDIDEIWGIGKNLSAMFRKNGILNAYELVSQTDVWLNSKVGIRALEMKHELLGECISPVSSDIKLPKSIQKTASFSKFTSDKNYIKNSLNYHIHRACAKLRKINAKTSDVSVMLKTKDFHSYYEKRVLPQASDFELEISEVIFELMEKIYDSKVLYRSSGVVFGSLVYNTGEQLFLFADTEETIKKEKLVKCFDKLEDKFGKNVVKIGFMPEKEED